MDHETGEGFPDKETGELPAKPKVNQETGEKEINYTNPPDERNKKKFKIPRKETAMQVLQSSRKPLNNSSQAVNISDMTACVVYLLPTVLFFYPVLAIILGVLELCLHYWAHKKNKTLENKDIFYQSPLHIIVSEFCASCRDKNLANKVTKLQDKRNIKYGIDYVRRVVT